MEHTSPDGRIRAVTDPAGGGVFLIADYSQGRNQADFASSITGWVPYGAGTSAVYDDHAVHVTWTGASGSRGATWTLPTPITGDNYVDIVIAITVDNPQTATGIRFALAPASGVIYQQFDHQIPDAHRTTWYTITAQVPAGSTLTKLHMFLLNSTAANYRIEVASVIGRDLPDPVRKVRFVRGPDRLPVRSGNDTWAPGGSAIAYDREAPLGAASAWYAIPIFHQAGVYVDGPMSQGAQVIPEPLTPIKDFWVKSIATGKQMKLEAWTPDPESGLEGRDAGQPVPGQSLESGGWDTPIEQPITYVFLTKTIPEFQQLDDLVKYGPMLVQTLAMYGIPDTYAKLVSLRWAYLTGAYAPEREVTITFKPCKRPPTIDGPLYVPGVSWADVVASFVDWAAVIAGVDSWRELLTVPLPAPGEVIEESGEDDGDEGP